MTTRAIIDQVKDQKGSDTLPPAEDATRFVREKNVAIFIDYDIYDFLEIEVIEYSIEEHVEKAVRFLYDWHRNSRNADYAMSYVWLRDKLMAELDLPQDTTNELITHLETSELIKHEMKDTGTGNRKNFIVNLENDRAKAIIAEHTKNQ